LAKKIVSGPSAVLPPTTTRRSVTSTTRTPQAIRKLFWTTVPALDNSRQQRSMKSDSMTERHRKELRRERVLNQTPSEDQHPLLQRAQLGHFLMQRRLVAAAERGDTATIQMITNVNVGVD
jgi:hypothetical protein